MEIFIFIFSLQYHGIKSPKNWIETVYPGTKFSLLGPENFPKFFLAVVSGYYLWKINEVSTRYLKLGLPVLLKKMILKHAPYCKLARKVDFFGESQVKPSKST